MATSKAKSTKSSSAKKSTAAKKPAAKKTTAKKPAAKKTTASKNTVKTVKATAKVTAVEAEKVGSEKTKIVSEEFKTEKKSVVKEFFARKGDPNENILTIFKDTKIIGAIIGEIIGTGLVTSVALTLGLFNPLYLIFAYTGITAAVFALSGAHLNPAITAGMMATRRVSAIRGTIYIIAQLIGAWAGFMIVNAFYNAGVNSGNIDAANTLLPTLATADSITASVEGYSFFWPITMIEFLGAMIISFFFARALDYKRGAFTFAAVVAGGVFLATLFAVVICSNFLGIQENVFIMNPASAFMYGLLPASAEGFDALIGQLMPMLATYVIFPVFGGILGFYISDIAGKLSHKELKA
ncbi:MAG: aquaporin [Candidatus Saccharibacteria bacterium]|nr:aquaporin [Candidatus Saccharibacteria bacterium]